MEFFFFFGCFEDPSEHIECDAQASRPIRKIIHVDHYDMVAILSIRATWFDHMSCEREAFNEVNKSPYLNVRIFTFPWDISIVKCCRSIPMLHHN